MSLNIPSKILDITDDVVININLKKLGPRQLAALTRMATCGVIEGEGPPALIASSLRQMHGASTIHKRPYRNFCVFRATPEMKNDLRVAIVTSKLDPESDYYSKHVNSTWYQGQVKHDATCVSEESNKETFNLSTISDMGWKMLKKRKVETPPSLHALVKQIEAGEVTKIPLKANNLF